MALNDRQVNGVIELFAKAFAGTDNENERKKILIDFEDTFGKSIKEWKLLCREEILKISGREQDAAAFDAIANRKENQDYKKEYEIRAFRKEDIPEVCEILNAAFDMCITPFDERKFEKFLSNEYSFVACENGSVIGVVLACLLPGVDVDEVYINSFAVARHTRGCGAGRKLFLHLCKKLKNKGIWVLRLQTQRTREAYEIYKHWGFEEMDMVQMRRYVLGE